VLLVPGSGPHDRDETLLGHKVFLVLADYLTRKGIVVLRVDDRGVGKSTGQFANATTADLATDAEAGVAYLKTLSEVDPHKVGVIGHSEGGLIAPMVAARNADVAFIVMMAGPGVAGDEILLEQGLLKSEAAGASPAAAEKAAASRRELLLLVKQEKDNALLEKELREKLAGLPEAQINAQIKQLTSPWFRYFIAYDPAAALQKVKCPVLALNGEKDLQVPPKQNLPAIRKALQEGGNQHVEIDELPGLNHLFQTAKTGAPSEYGEIEETMSPVAMEKIATWILMEPKPVGVFNVLSTTYVPEGNYDHAIQDYTEAIRQNPQSASAFPSRGSAYLDKGDYDQAVQDFNQAIRLDPQSASALNGRGYAYFAKGNYDPAVRLRDPRGRLTYPTTWDARDRLRPYRLSRPAAAGVTDKPKPAGVECI
jgi:pimeloyl-ACP methyl ester carboxylesterase